MFGCVFLLDGFPSYIVSGVPSCPGLNMAITFWSLPPLWSVHSWPQLDISYLCSSSRRVRWQCFQYRPTCITTGVCGYGSAPPSHALHYNPRDRPTIIAPQPCPIGWASSGSQLKISRLTSRKLLLPVHQHLIVSSALWLMSSGWAFSQMFWIIILLIFFAYLYRSVYFQRSEKDNLQFSFHTFSFEELKLGWNIVNCFFCFWVQSGVRS